MGTYYFLYTGLSLFHISDYESSPLVETYRIGTILPLFYRRSNLAKAKPTSGPTTWDCLESVITAWCMVVYAYTSTQEAVAERP